jgi:hypothetical protein
MVSLRCPGAVVARQQAPSFPWRSADGVSVRVLYASTASYKVKFDVRGQV